MFAGMLPFTADTAIHIAMKHVQELPPSPRAVQPALPVPLEHIILRCLRKDPSARYQKVEDLQAELLQPSVLQT